ncbi:D-ribose pyranase [Janthinobacterium sp. B9-8]|uniref:D-ribose pyranase n=1 Tax=Janthinobacterium sp. B9-8 TaxID=1236179 RepID=UPI00061D0DE3|nr:D-ribose pyranase [Janthinobacterium sp. B9-8]AMC33512.1 ribose pyranase [Janthinobacterium sp. B9-8]
MKKHGILNSELARVLARLGHTDSIVIADCGLPIPDHVERIDLALKLGQPSFVDTLQEILSDMQVERAVFATECLATNPTVAAQAQAMQSSGISIDFVSHEEFKQLCHNAKAVIRTGEASPYANIILHSGVIF